MQIAFMAYNSLQYPQPRRAPEYRGPHLGVLELFLEKNLRKCSKSLKVSLTAAVIPRGGGGGGELVSYVTDIVVGTPEDCNSNFF